VTRYIERGALRELLVPSLDPTAAALASKLERDNSVELVSIKAVSAAEMLPTYEIRLAASESGRGPRTTGLREFVTALRESEIGEGFGITVGDVRGIGLLSPEGEIVAVTLVHADM